MGKNVRYFQAYEHHYIRIDNNKVMTDNLGELPGLVESQQEEKPVLAEAKPEPVVETKPLSALSSAFFSEQVEEELAEVTPEPAKVMPEPAEVTPEVTKKKVVKIKSNTKKKTSKKRVSKKKTSKKRVSKKRKRA